MKNLLVALWNWLCNILGLQWDDDREWYGETGVHRDAHAR